MRIYTGSNDPLDFCDECAPADEEEAFELHGEGEGSDGRGNCFAFDAEHPYYSEANYHCAGCGRILLDGAGELQVYKRSFGLEPDWDIYAPASS